MFDNKEYVYEAYREKSFSKAAENLFISQPSLSLTIKKIENNIGSQLFDRSTYPVKLTESGAEYIKCVEKIRDIENDYKNYLSELNNLKTGSLIIGASSFFSCYTLPPIITKFKLKYPQVTIKLVEANTPYLEKQLFIGALDLIIDNYSFDEDIYKKHFFFSEQMILAVPEKLPYNKAAKMYMLTADDIVRNRHLEASTPPVPLALFEDAPFLLLRPGNDTRDRANKILKEHHIAPHIILELDQQATAYHIACNGMGLTLVSDTLVKEMVPDTRIVYYKIESAHTRREICFYYKHSKCLTRSMQEFLLML